MIIKNTNDKWEKNKYEKQHKRDKRYIRQPKKPEVKKYCYYSEGILESEPEGYHSYGYDESYRKTLLPKKKTKRDRLNLSEDENNAETEEEEVEGESESENDSRMIKKQTKQNKPPPYKKTKNVKTKKGIM